MKLRHDDAWMRLVGRYADLPEVDVVGIVDDACELLTLRVVLLLKKRATLLKEQMKTKAVDSDARRDLASQVNGLQKFLVELTETE